MMSSRAEIPSLAAAMVFLPLGLGLATPAVTGAYGEPYGVFVELASPTGMTFDGAVEALEGALRMAELEVLAGYEAGVDADACSYRAHVLVAHRPELAAELLERGSHAAFALPLRLAVYEDERGLHVAAVNPFSIIRTVVSEEGFAGPSAEVMELLEGVAESAFPGRTRLREYGQVRTEGLISKTMGIIAGGPFTGKIERIANVRLTGGRTPYDIARTLGEALSDPGGGSWKWGIRSIYAVSLSDDVAVVGLTGESVEEDAFRIVGSGGDETRDDLACPGLDHAPAFPIELVIDREGDEARIRIVDAMFRMKMYFEDAGKMKFAMNMRMPGSIEDEIRDKVDEALSEY